MSDVSLMIDSALRDIQTKVDVALQAGDVR